jgi:hypothetical protein
LFIVQAPLALSPSPCTRQAGEGSKTASAARYPLAMGARQKILFQRIIILDYSIYKSAAGPQNSA